MIKQVIVLLVGIDAEKNYLHGIYSFANAHAVVKISGLHQINKIMFYDFLLGSLIIYNFY